MIKFLRTLVWIDDEIRPDKTDATGEAFRSFFYPTAQEFQKRKLLVHLHPYDADISSTGGDNIFDEDSESFGSAVTLAKKADVVVLDWHLGRNDPKNSIELLKKLKDESAIRYIIVLSQYAERFEDEMKAEEMMVGDSGNITGSHLFQNIGGAWADIQGTHIIVMRKPAPGASAVDFSNSVIEAIYDLMSKANPDYLHWAAIEIAAKLRHSIPGWVQAIPRGTDAAFLSELKSEKCEARDFIPEHLLEDLSHKAKLHVLKSLDLDSCNPEHWKNKSYTIQATVAGSERYKKFVHFSFPALKLEKKDVDTIRQQSGSDQPSKSFLISQQAFTEFCENISSAPEAFPTFGAVYIEKTTNGASGLAGNKDLQTIYLCLSQECDSLRSDNLLILEGSVTQGSSTQEGVTRLSLQGKIFGFLPEARSIQSVTVDNGSSGGYAQRLEKFDKIGQLRKATARRILSRFWNHLSRSAVNLSRFTLKDREGE
jgi:HPt (histidine-containing phosphotransfer) domain-containing protein